MQRTDSLERPWCWEGLGASGEGDNRGWDCWMVSLTRWTGVCMNSGSWWWTGRPGVLWFLGSKELDRTEQLNWTELNWISERIIPTVSEEGIKGWRVLEIGSLPTFWALKVGLGAVLVPLGVSLSLLMCYSEPIYWGSRSSQRWLVCHLGGIWL